MAWFVYVKRVQWKKFCGSDMAAIFRQWLWINRSPEQKRKDDLEAELNRQAVRRGLGILLGLTASLGGSAYAGKFSSGRTGHMYSVLDDILR